MQKYPEALDDPQDGLGKYREVPQGIPQGPASRR